MQNWRKSHPLNDLQKMKDISRSYAGVYKRRGHLTPRPCQICGSSEVEMHHPDYSTPLRVEWMCRECHLDHHHGPCVSRLTKDEDGTEQIGTLDEGESVV